MPHSGEFKGVTPHTPWVLSTNVEDIKMIPNRVNDVIDDLSQRFQQKPHPAEKEKLPEQE